MFVTLVIRLTPFCQIIEILIYSHVYRDTRAYILDPCIQVPFELSLSTLKELQINVQRNYTWKFKSSHLNIRQVNDYCFQTNCCPHEMRKI